MVVYYLLHSTIALHLIIILQIRTLDKEIQVLKEKIKSLEFQLGSLPNEQKLLTPIKNELKASTCKRPTYNLEDISFATCVYSAGPRCYKLLRQNDYALPSPTTLRRWASKLSVEPGLQYQTLVHMGSLDLP
ncbi:Transposable element P transposase [Lucilia cuprina]|nr:Transposable element P transposase [Lucilia cuprina]